jgi:uncharacterized membrane protein YhaH (DUF805 family)
MENIRLGSCKIDLNGSRINFIQLRNSYNRLSFEILNKFNLIYPTFGTADQLFRDFPDILNSKISNVVEAVSNDLAANRIFDVSEKSIRAELEARVDDIAKDFLSVREKYFAILGNAAVLDAQRKASMENRGGIIGGGFGIEGAAKGIALATAANAAIGLTHGLANAAAKAISDRSDNKKKQQLLNDPATKASMGKLLEGVVLLGCDLVAETVNKRSSAPIFEMVSEESKQKSAAIVENVKAGRVPADSMEQVLTDSLNYNLFNIDSWTCWVEYLGDLDGSVESSAKSVGIQSIGDFKRGLLLKRKGTFSWTVPEECHENSMELEKYALWLGVDFETERRLIQSLASRLDKERRTFNGIEYESLAEAYEARNAHQNHLRQIAILEEDRVKRTVDGTIYDHIDQADQVRTLKREKAIASSKGSNHFEWSIMSYRRVFDLTGRSSRVEFRYFLALTVGLAILAGIVFAITEFLLSVYYPLKTIEPLANSFFACFIFGSSIFAFGLEIRRFHDFGLSGWLVLLNFIPYVGLLIVLVLLFGEGAPRDNRFGPSPKSALA